MIRKRINTNKSSYLIKLMKGIIYFLAISLAFSYFVLAEEQFNTSFIHGDANITQVSTLGRTDEILPGNYPCDIYLNGQHIDHRYVKFKKITENVPIVPCLSSHDYQDYGIKLPNNLTVAQCYLLPNQISDAKIRYDPSIQRIDLIVPQLFLIPRPRGAISPSIYDRGINAFFINYNFSGHYNRYNNLLSRKTSEYCSLTMDTGLNLGNWRLRNHLLMHQQYGIRSYWNNISTWAETDIIPMRSRFVVGQSNTDNAVFDSVQFRGVQLSSANDMLAESQLGYAPAIYGVASSSARIEIRQNGYMIYSTNVSPGPFVLNDIVPSNLSGNLDVVIREANGTRNSFTVPFSAVPNMLREGIWNYQLTSGKYYNNKSSYQPKFIQCIILRGMIYDVTPYVGVLVAENYRSAVIGFGKNIGNLGAFSLGIAHSEIHLLNDDTKQGESLRFLYSKSLNNWGTTFQMAAYRYSTSGYYYFIDAVAEHNRYKNGHYNNHDTEADRFNVRITGWVEPDNHDFYHSRLSNKRQRIELTVNQSLPGQSTLYANFSNQSYWGVSNDDLSLQAGLNSSYKNITYGIFYQNHRINYINRDQSINFTTSIPLNFFSNTSSDSTAIFNTSHSKKSGNTYNVGLSGSALEEHRLNYSMQVGYDRHSGQEASANISYQNSIGIINASYAYGKDYQQSLLAVAGGVVVHTGGVTMTQPLQNTFVLIEAKNAKGVRLENQSGIAIDKFGYAVMTSALPYRYNRVALRAEDIWNGLDIPTAAQDAVPTHGAIIKLKFDTHTGRSLLVHTNMKKGVVPPIGANVFSANGKSRGIVGANGDIYISGVSTGDRLLVTWGSDVNESCSLVVPELQPDSNQLIGYQELLLSCG